MFCLFCCVVTNLYFHFYKLILFYIKYFHYFLSGFYPTEVIKTPVDPFINGVYYPVSYWTEKGGRPYQEDRYHCLKGKGTEDSSLYGVYDGKYYILHTFLIEFSDLIFFLSLISLSIHVFIHIFIRPSICNFIIYSPTFLFQVMVDVGQLNTAKKIF